MFIDTVHPVLQEMLEEIGFICSDFTKKSEIEISSELPDYQGIVLRSRFKITRELIDAGTKLKFIARSGSGLENIDTDYAKRKNIQCFNSPEGNKDALGEHCIAMLLGLFNNISKAHQEITKSIWQRESNRGIELKGKTVGIIGYGKMGESFAQKLSGFGVKVIAYDQNKTGFTSDIVQEVSMDKIFSKSEVVSLHINYTKDNYHLVGDEFIKAFKNNFYIINSARGNCINTSALIKGLEEGKILGACLDVLELEKADFELSKESKKTLDKLCSFSQVLLTPHIGGWTNESYYKLSKVLGEKIKKMDNN